MLSGSGSIVAIIALRPDTAGTTGVSTIRAGWTAAGVGTGAGCIVVARSNPGVATGGGGPNITGAGAGVTTTGAGAAITDANTTGGGVSTTAAGGGVTRAGIDAASGMTADGVTKIDANCVGAGAGTGSGAFAAGTSNKGGAELAVAGEGSFVRLVSPATC